MTRPVAEIESALALLESHPTILCEQDAYDITKVRVSFLWAGVQGAMRWMLGKEGYAGRIASKLREFGHDTCIDGNCPDTALSMLHDYKFGLKLETAQTRIDHYWLGVIWGLEWLLREPGPVADKLSDLQAGGSLEVHTVELWPWELEGAIRAVWPELTVEES